jgi:hypothetical protein
MNVVSIASPRAADGDPLRDALRSALQAETEARDAVERQKSAISRAWKATRAAAAVVAERAKGVEAAQGEHHAAIAAAHAADEPAPAPSGVRLARQGLEDAEENASAHAVAHRNLKADLPVRQAEALAAEANVDEIVSAILAGPAEHLIAKAEELILKLEPITHVLRGLIGDGETRRMPTIEESFAQERARKPLNAVRERAMTVLNAAVNLARMQGNERELFQEARRRLRADPGAELPEALRQ